MTSRTTQNLLLAAAAAWFAGTAWAAAEGSARIVTAVDGRNGPGSYYAAGAKLLQGAAVKVTERRGNWVRAEVEKQAAWIPAYALDSEQRNARPGEIFRQVTKNFLRSVTGMIDMRDRPQYLTRSAVTLGIRGFSSAYSAHKGFKASDADPALWEQAAFDAAAYEAFVAARFKGRDWQAFKRRLPLDPPAPVADPEADKLGAALTGYVARQDGLLRNPALEAYLSQVATLVAESSHAYEMPVRVYVLNSRELKGFVSPNGIVFVSAGALERMKSEAEFAFFVGHEIAHIAFQHGLKKVETDVRVKENDAFAEMETDLEWDKRGDDKYVRTANELSELADQIHEYFSRENNDRDELEADYWGLIYAARAGYVPEAAESLLLRMVAEGGKGDGALLWNGVARSKRLDGCRKAFAQIKIERDALRSFDAEFEAGKKAAGT